MNQWTNAAARIVAAAALSGTVLVGGLTTTATADDGSAVPAMTCSQLWQSLPQRLQRDIDAARSLPPRAQQVAMRSIRQAALAGGYGAEVQQRAQARQDRRQELWASAPDQLKADVRAAQSLDWREQRRAMTAIRRAALAGVYGDAVQSVAQARKDWLQTCPRSGDLV